MPMPADNPVTDLAASQLPAPTGKPQASEVRAGALVLRTLDFADYQPPPSRVPACRPGDWLGIRLADDTTGLGQVCHISQGSQRILLLNPERGLAVAMHPAILDHQLEPAMRSSAPGSRCSRTQPPRHQPNRPQLRAGVRAGWPFGRPKWPNCLKIRVYDSSFRGSHGHQESLAAGG